MLDIIRIVCSPKTQFLAPPNYTTCLNVSYRHCRASSLMANLPQGQPLLSRPGLGVPVLPPIPPRSSTSPSFPSSHTSPPSHPPSSSPPCPPPYQRQSSPTGDGGNRSGSPPPPYYPSPHGANDNRRFSQPVPLPSQQHTPSHFTLPDPQVCNFMLFATKFCASFAGIFLS